MIGAIYIMDTEFKISIQKSYITDELISSFIPMIKEEPDISFFQLEDYTMVTKLIGNTRICFITKDENEMYVLSVIEVFMCKVENSLGSFEHPSVLYHFREILNILDDFVLNGKVISFTAVEN